MREDVDFHVLAFWKSPSIFSLLSTHSAQVHLKTICGSAFRFGICKPRVLVSKRLL